MADSTDLLVGLIGDRSDDHGWRFSLFYAGSHMRFAQAFTLYELVASSWAVPSAAGWRASGGNKAWQIRLLYRKKVR